MIAQPFRPDTTVSVPDRPLGDLLGEELRRLDPDQPYSEALSAATGVSGLAERSPVREYVWVDPMQQDVEPAVANGGSKPTPRKSGSRQETTR